MITVEQARELRESLADVFIPNGDAGVITAIRGDGGMPLTWYARVKVDETTTRNASHGWYLLTMLDSAATLGYR